MVTPRYDERGGIVLTVSGIKARALCAIPGDASAARIGPLQGVCPGGALPPQPRHRRTTQEREASPALSGCVVSPVHHVVWIS